jgi:hypothetical protein
MFFVLIKVASRNIAVQYITVNGSENTATWWSYMGNDSISTGTFATPKCLGDGAILRLSIVN